MPQQQQQLHKKLFEEIQKGGTKLRKTFAATTRLAKKNQMTHAVQARIIKSVSSDEQLAAAKHARTSINAQLIKRAAEKQIKQMGAKPIALLAKNSIKTGVPVAFVTSHHSAGRVHKKVVPAASASTKHAPTSPTKTDTGRDPVGERITKAISSEIKRLAGNRGKLRPSEVKERTAVASVKTAVNTEIRKRAVVHEIKGTKRPTSPVRSLAKILAPSTAGATVTKKSPSSLPGSPTRGKIPTSPSKSKAIGSEFETL
eukprot:jgi/Hompol1/5980/HPOL_004789-RA